MVLRGSSLPPWLLAALRAALWGSYCAVLVTLALETSPLAPTYRCPTLGPTYREPRSSRGTTEVTRSHGGNERALLVIGMVYEYVSGS